MPFLGVINLCHVQNGGPGHVQKGFRYASLALLVAGGPGDPVLDFRPQLGGVDQLSTAAVRVARENGLKRVKCRACECGGQQKSPRSGAGGSILKDLRANSAKQLEFGPEIGPPSVDQVGLIHHQCAQETQRRRITSGANGARRTPPPGLRSRVPVSRS